MNLTIFRGIMR